MNYLINISRTFLSLARLVIETLETNGGGEFYLLFIMIKYLKIEF